MEVFFPIRPPFKKLAGKHGKKTPMGFFFHVFPLIFQMVGNQEKRLNLQGGKSHKACDKKLFCSQDGMG